MYACPDCKTALENLYCSQCDHHFAATDGIPILLTRNPRFQEAANIAAAYDSIYRKKTNVWENQGRTPEFLRFFAGRLAQYSASRYLEIGCGEAFLLAAVRAGEKAAIDLSVQALKAAQQRTEAHVCVALAERLPFPADYFDLVASVGVMEHFLDDQEVAREIWRTLRPGGHYVALLHVHLTFWERLGVKLSQYVFPTPRPVQFTRWLLKAIKAAVNGDAAPRYVKQPIQNKFTTRSAKASIEKNRFRVVEVCHTRRRPELPLAGPHVVIYFAQK
jgi:SAM-dependent methyltransferase